ncbi:MAG: hypothetical protein KAQ68_06785 [Clostridiales bacterium]|nr:hypothetical protein [Clostridiales bacterium]
MGLGIYEGRKNNENHINVSDSTKKSVTFDTDKVIAQITKLIKSDKKTKIAFDGWYGVHWSEIMDLISSACKLKGLSLEMISADYIFRSRQEIKSYKKRFITNDPAFGWENLDGVIEDIIDTKKVHDLKKKLVKDEYDSDVLFVYGSGCAIDDLIESYDIIFYFDKLVQYVLPQMWSKTLVPLGFDGADSEYDWKEYYYCDYHLLFKHKLYLIDKFDYYIDALDVQDLKLLPKSAYDDIVTTLLKYPIKEIEVYQGGPWGAYRFKQIEEIEGLECNAWHTLMSSDLSMEVDFGGERMLNLPFALLMKYPKKLVGKHVAEKYPLLFPFQVGLDDGWFSEPTPRERTAMPMHNHPSIDYCKRNFNEIFGRYETYYIAEAYKDAGTFMGYKEGCDLEEWEEKCRESDNLKEIPDWQDYCKLWDTKVGDLFLIPPGTVHGHGGNQMVLEMDTCPAIACNEYSFFIHDFARKTWNDSKKEMSGKPMRMHLDHGFNNEHWRRESYVEKNLRSQPKVIFTKDEYCIERYSSIDEMPFHIERIHYYDRAEYSTGGKFTHVLTLTRGMRVLIRSLSNPELKAEVVRYHCATIPASFGDYELISLDGGFQTAVLIRLKVG